MEKYFQARGIPIAKSDMWPRYPGVFVRRPAEWDSGDEAVRSVRRLSDAGG
jgi:hypothetical protein